MNKAAEALLGRTTGRRFTSLFAPEAVNGARDQFARKMLGAAEPSRCRTSLIAKNGARIPAELFVVSLRRSGRPVGVLAIALPVDEPRGEGERQTTGPDLTPRQHDVLRLLADGRTTDEIAAHLGIAQETVRNHIRTLLRQLRVRTRTEAVSLAFRSGWL
jgi:DNA-binding CsgD family transcriptional regulator